MRLVKIASIALACGVVAVALPPAVGAWRDYQRQNFCTDDKFAENFADTQKKRAEHMTEALKLTDAQQAAFKELQDVRAKNFLAARTAQCGAKPGDLAADQRLEFLQTRTQASLDALKAETPKLLAFVNTLDETQKKRFDEMTRHEGPKGPGPGPHGGFAR